LLETRRDTEISQRAYLWANFPKELFDPEIRIPLENGGRIPSPRVAVSAHVFRKRLSDNATLDTQAYNFGGDRTKVPPGIGHYEIAVPLNNWSDAERGAIDGRTEEIVVAGNIDYDDGFGHMDQNSYCFKRHSEFWQSCPIVTFADLKKMPPKK
jgi:hypothetical protein